jgi:hypothetical protein
MTLRCFSLVQQAALGDGLTATAAVAHASHVKKRLAIVDIERIRRRLTS